MYQFFYIFESVDSFLSIARENTTNKKKEKRIYSTQFNYILPISHSPLYI